MSGTGHGQFEVTTLCGVPGPPGSARQWVCNLEPGHPGQHSWETGTEGEAAPPSAADLDRTRELAGLMDRIQSDPDGKLDRILGEVAAIRRLLEAAASPEDRQLTNAQRAARDAGDENWQTAGRIAAMLRSAVEGSSVAEIQGAVKLLTEAERTHLGDALEAVESDEADAWYYSQPEGN